MQNKITTGRFFPSIPYLVFFTVMFIWFAFFGEYVLFFQEKSSLFFLTGEYLIEKTSRPGGALVYLSEFLSSFFYNPATGAIVLSGIITSSAFLISRSISLLSGRNEKFFPLIIGFLLFYLHTNYSFFLLSSLGLMMQILLFILFIRTEKHSILTAFILIPLWYFLTGGYSWIFMFLLTFRWLLFPAGHRWIKVLLSWLLLVLTFIVSKEFIFFESEKNLIFYPYSLPDESLARTLLLLASILTCMTPLVAWIKFKVPNLLSSSYLSETGIRSFVLLSVTLLVAVYRFDRKNDQYFKIERWFYEGKYDEIIEENTHVPSANSLTLFFNNIALAETGVLNDRLFGFLQSPQGQTLFLKWEMVSEILKRGGYFYYNIGMINEAHRWAFENMVMDGHTPEGMKLLIKTELINGNYHMASKYISLLNKTLFYRKDADRFEKMLFSDHAVEADTELGPKRKIRVKRDFFSVTDDPFLNVQRVAMSDSLNHTAFDYMIAAMLLKKDYAGIAASLPLFEKMGYSGFPVHVQEAILAISTMNNEKLQTGNLNVSRMTEERWTQFLTVFQQYDNNPRAAEPALRKQFGNTFWYWAFYK